MRPVYATRGTLGDELRRRAPGVAAAITPSSSDADRFMATDRYREEKRNFYEDVMRLKQVDSARADSIAGYAVREAYRRGISPAIVFGVMLTENAKFISKATSNVGAVGLMQVYPKVWLNKEMTGRFGGDLASDSTNVKYGVFILNHYFNPRTKKGDTRERDWATALLRYNGCVRGTNTKHCHTYPGKVKDFVENQATSICAGRSFYDCIAKPFVEGLFGATADGPAKGRPDSPATPPASAPATSSPTAAAAAPPASPSAPPAAPLATPTSTPAPVAVEREKQPPARPTGKRTSTAASKARTTSSRRKPAAKRSTSARRPARAEPSIPAAPKPIEVRVP
jgi:hypothetical protein